LSKNIKISIDTNGVLGQLKLITDKLHEPGLFDLVIQFKGSASPEDKLENTITAVIKMLDTFKKSFSDIANIPTFLLKFVGNYDGTTQEALTLIITKVQKALADASVAWKGIINFLIQFMGNDGSGETWINTIITNITAKFATLTATLNKGATYTVTTKYVTEGKGPSGSSSTTGLSNLEQEMAIDEMAEGGEVPGTGNTDTVPAMLTPGEFVIQKSVVGALGEGFFNMINGLKNFSIPKFNTNNMVQAFASGGSVQSRHQETFTLNLAIGQTKVPLRVVGNPTTVRKQIKTLERELDKMRLSHA
jgi:hypothetical protein